MADNVFAPATETAAFTLFTPTQVAVATFLASPFAGATLIWMNARRLGLPQGTVVLWTGGVIGLIGVAAMVLPDAVPSVAFNLVGMFGMRTVAEQLQSRDLAAHLAGGGVAAPWLVVVGVTFAWLAVFVTIVGAVLLVVLAG